MAPESGSSSSAQIVRIAKPSAGEELRIASIPGGDLVFAFDPAAATITRADNDLVMEVDGGGTVRLADFFVVGDSTLPSLVLPDGTSVASADFLSNFDIELETAAGPGAGAGTPGSGMNDYADDAGSLVDGIGRLGSLGTDQWGYELEETEVFETLAALEEDLILPEQPGVGPDTPPEEPVTPEASLDARHNVGELAVDLTTPGTRTPVWVQDKEGGVRDPWDEVTDSISMKDAGWNALRTENAGGENDPYVLWSKESKFDTDLAAAIGAKFDVADAINDILPEGTFYSEGGDGDANFGKISLEAGQSIQFDYTVDLHNNGNFDDQDAFFWMLVDKDGNLVDKGLFFQLDPAIHEPGGVYSGLANFTPNIEINGEYTLVIGQVEEGGSNGQKTLTTIGDMEIITHHPAEPYPPTGHFEYDVTGPEYAVNASGNVIPNDTFTDEEGNTTQLSGNAFISEWKFTDPYSGEDVTINPSEDPLYEFPGGTLTLNADGSWSLQMTSTGEAPNLADWNIQYTVEDGGLSDSSTLYLRPEGHENIIASDESDIFAVTGDSTIIGFTLGEDLISFEGLQDLGAIDLAIGENGALTLTVPGDAGYSVNVNVEGSAVEQFAADYTANHGSDEGLAQALLAQMIQSSSGG